MIASIILGGLALLAIVYVIVPALVYAGLLGTLVVKAKRGTLR